MEAFDFECLPRIHLHAERVSFAHPVDGETVRERAASATHVALARECG